MNTFKKYLLAVSAVSLVAGTIFVSQANAEYKPNRKNNDMTREQVEELGYTGLLARDKLKFNLYQKPNAPAHEIIFQVYISTPIEGCLKVIPFEITSEIKAKTLEIYTDFPIVSEDRDGNCDYKSYSPRDEVILDKDELIEKGVNKVALKSKYGTKNLDLYIDDELIELTSDNDVFVKDFEFWMLPKNTVVVTVPMADGDLIDQNHMLQDLAIVAEDSNLIPIEEKNPDYMPKKAMVNRFYFLDTDGSIRDMLNNGASTVRLGEIYKTEPFYGPNGKYDKKIPIDVIATLPNEYD